MIGKTEWFQRRRLGGWGIRPRTWQGWVYIAVLVAVPLAVVYGIPTLTEDLREKFLMCWVALIVVDILHIMITMKVDEREHKIEALSERNASWAMVTAIGIGVVYQAWQTATGHMIGVDPFLLITLIAGAAVKAISDIYYSRKSL